MNAQEQEILEKLQALRDAFAAQLPSRLKEIQDMWQLQCSEDWDWKRVDVLHRLIHTMTGSAPTFGFVELGNQARETERLIKSWVKEQRIPNPGTQANFEKMLEGLATATDNQPASTGNKPAAEKQALETDKRLVYIFDQDQDFSVELALQLTQVDYHPRVYSNSDELFSALDSAIPAAIIIDAAGCKSGVSGTDITAQIKQGKAKDIPVLMLSGLNDFDTRLQAVRCGSDSFFNKPVEPTQLTDKLDKLTQNDKHEPYRVLIIDDDPALATHYQLTLQKAGIDAYTVTNPHTIMEIMADVRPDLIVMDIYMPTCSGLELATLIRQQESYVSTPIVYLSTEADLDKQLSAMRIGGDDFLTKPINDQHLISSITIRAERSRLLNSFMMQDSLTGLLKHTKIKDQLAIEISRSTRSKTPLTFAMLDIDHFKNVNDSYGHITGDRVIKSLARLLQQRLRKTDSIGRYGGEEFAVVLPTCDLECAENVLNEIRKSFSEIRFNSNSEQFNVTISIGIASLENYHTPETINQAADEALYLAKDRGRNQVIIADLENITLPGE